VQSSAKRIILEHETNEQRNALDQRRSITKGKRVFLKNKFLVTIKEILGEVKGGENETLERSQKMTKKRHKNYGKLASTWLR
jgi:hypothetical protein